MRAVALVVAAGVALASATGACSTETSESAGEGANAVSTTSRSGTPRSSPHGAPATTSEAVDEQRIIPVNGDLAEIVWALGLGDQVVATDISATYPPAAERTEKIGYQRALTAETILTYEPSIVLADDLAGSPTYPDMTGRVGRRDGEWIVPRDEFCGVVSHVPGVSCPS